LILRRVCGIAFLPVVACLRYCISSRGTTRCRVSNSVLLYLSLVTVTFCLCLPTLFSISLFAVENTASGEIDLMCPVFLKRGVLSLIYRHRLLSVLACCIFFCSVPAVRVAGDRERRVPDSADGGRPEVVLQLGQRRRDARDCTCHRGRLLRQSWSVANACTECRARSLPCPHIRMCACVYALRAHVRVHAFVAVLPAVRPRTTVPVSATALVRTFADSTFRPVPVHATAPAHGVFFLDCWTFWVKKQSVAPANLVTFLKIKERLPCK
jgi:hypothetical protein